MDIASAVRYGDKELVTDLLDGVSDVNFQDRNGNTGLIIAAQAGKLDIVELLLYRGAGIDIIDNQGVTAQERALEAGHYDIEKLIKTARKYKKENDKVRARQRLSFSKQSHVADDISEMISGHLNSVKYSADVARKMRRASNKKKKKKKKTKKKKKKKKAI